MVCRPFQCTIVEISIGRKVLDAVFGSRRSSNTTVSGETGTEKNYAACSTVAIVSVCAPLASLLALQLRMMCACLSTGGDRHKGPVEVAGGKQCRWMILCSPNHAGNPAVVLKGPVALSYPWVAAQVAASWA
ncbi:unnamed protein product [Ostreobium quekettii]|uniref:Uncharacterized protein n=1 Tax=Ostreobium quekettii TaxID=121088 RepID=A0A8S1J1S8_9CHLO|nr:unnamed protein product [Ostreobium quekettii]